MRKIIIFLGVAVFIAFITIAYFRDPDFVRNTKAENNPIAIDTIASPLEYEIINIEDRDVGYIIIKVKIINIGKKHIHSAYVTCVLVDPSGKELNLMSHYVIKSTEGGLPPGGHTYYTYIMEGSREQIGSVKFKIKSMV